MESMGNILIQTEPTQNKSALTGLLPFQFCSLQVRNDQRPRGFRFYNHSVTIVAYLHDREILVCGEANSQEMATAKALSELIERATLIEYSMKNPSILKSSNGWAAHPNKDTAKLNAILEVVERDAVLAQWFSSTPFLQIDSSSLPESIQNWINQELKNSEFPNLKILISTKGLGPSVTCVFMNESGMGVSGHSCKMDLFSAVENALGETCRAAQLTLRNAFYSDTEILKSGKTDAKINPGAHAVYYAYQEAFPDWIFGKVISWSEAQTLWSEKIKDLQISEFDFFQVKTVLTDPTFVCFARHLKAIELYWGPLANKFNDQTFLLDRLKIENINNQPHPIS